MKNILTIAGSDSSGGAGIQADLKTFAAQGVYGMSVITAVTAQNTQGVMGVQNISQDIIAKQIDAVFQDIEVAAVKVGMVSQIETITTIALKLEKYHVQNMVLDPMMVSKSGYHLLEPDAKQVLVHKLLPLATIVTPNIPEAEVITGQAIKTLNDMEQAAQVIYKMGPNYVLVKGGHLENDATDILFDGEKTTYFRGEKIGTKNTHGTGCTLSSAIAANIGKGYSVIDAVTEAKKYITIAIEHALSMGKGYGPLNHFYELYQKAEYFK